MRTLLLHWRFWRYDRARLALADLRAYRRKWSFSHRPSDVAYYGRKQRRLERRLRRREAKVAALQRNEKP